MFGTLACGEANDSEIWQYAKANGFAIVSKDSDFNNAVCSQARRQNSFGYVLGIVPSREPRVC
jgi:predicted nuclease of predicted toxin-antitoxin system